MVEGVGFEPTKAEPSDLQSDPVGHLGTPPYENHANSSRKTSRQEVELADGIEPPTC